MVSRQCGSIICREAGSTVAAALPFYWSSWLETSPKKQKSTELSWVSGLAQWALAREPSDGEFKAEWLAIKPLYPRAPQRWRSLIARLLSAPMFKDAGIEAPGWWQVDTDFAPMMRENYTTTNSPLRSPMPQDCDRIIQKFDDPFKDVEPMIDELLRNHRRYVIATGDAGYFVRAIKFLGRGLIQVVGDNSHARIKKVQSIAREGLQWQPNDRYLWSLWRDAFEADHAVEAAELIGWEMIRRDLTHVDARTQLAIFLVNSLGKLNEAETLLKETVEKFPDNSVARSELAELLIFQDRTAEAASVLDAALSAGFEHGPIFAARVRVYAFKDI